MGCEHILYGNGRVLVNSSKVMTLKSYLAIGMLHLLLASYEALAVKDLREKRSKEDNLDDQGGKEVEGSGAENEASREG